MHSPALAHIFSNQPVTLLLLLPTINRSHDLFDGVAVCPSWNPLPCHCAHTLTPRCKRTADYV